MSRASILEEEREAELHMNSDDDDVCYIKRTREAEERLDHLRRAAVHKKGRVSSSEADDVGQAFEDDFKIKALGFKGAYKMHQFEQSSGKGSSDDVKGKGGKGKGKENMTKGKIKCGSKGN